MAQEIQHFTATIPAHTPVNAPVVVAVSTGVRIIRQIDWRVPSGPVGLMGWRITMGGVQVFPTVGDLWVIANNEHGSWPVADAPDSGAWQVTGYNTGNNQHSVYLAFHCDPPVKPAKLDPLLRAFEIMPSPDLSKAGPPVQGHT